MKFVRILLVEDTPPELDELTKGFIEASSELDADCKVVRAKNKGEAATLSTQYHYHLVSLDQNIPEKEGPNTSTVLGFELAEDLARKKLCFHGTIYTNVPEKDKMVSLLGTGFQYKEKHVLTDPSNNCYTFEDYTRLTFSEAVEVFPRKVLEKIRDGGLKTLSEYAGNTVSSYQQLCTDRTDDACSKFYSDFFPLFERSLWVLAALISNVAKGLSVEVESLPTFKSSGTPTSASILQWLRKAFGKLRTSTTEFPELEAYFTDGSQYSDLDDYFIDACHKLKDFRNEKVHSAQVIGFDEHEAIIAYFLRYFDVMSVIAVADIIVQPRRLGNTWVIDCIQLNLRFPSTQQPELSERDFALVGGASFPKNQILFRFPRLGFLVLTDHFSVSRNEKTRATQLEFYTWFKEKS